MSALAPLALAEVEASAACIAELQQVMAEGLIRIGQGQQLDLSLGGASQGRCRSLASGWMRADQVQRPLRYANSGGRVVLHYRAAAP